MSARTRIVLLNAPGDQAEHLLERCRPDCEIVRVDSVAQGIELLKREPFDGVFLNPNDPAVLYWFELKRNPADKSVDWIPHQIDDNSGVGTQVMATDVSGDGKPDVLVGNKKGAFVFIQQPGK